MQRFKLAATTQMYLSNSGNSAKTASEAMDALITPNALPPDKALIAQIDALEQQVRRRVQSVDNAEQWKRSALDGR